MELKCQTINDYRKIRTMVRITKRNRSKLKRQVRISTLKALTHHDAPYSFQARRAYRMLWHEAGTERARVTLAESAIRAPKVQHATA